MSRQKKNVANVVGTTSSGGFMVYNRHGAMALF